MNKRIYLLLFMLLFTLCVTNSVKAQVSGVTRTGQQGTTSETLKFLDLSGNETWIRPRLARTGENLFYKPLVSTDSANNIGAVTASVYGNIWHHGWKNITAQGFLVRKGDNNFADGNNDTIYTTASIDDCTNYPTGVPISANLTDLTPNTEYHYCAFATNEIGTTMGDPKTFTTITGVEIEVDVTAPVICSGSSKAVTFTATEMVEIPGTTYTWAINPTTGATYTTPIPTGSTFAVTFNPTSTTNYTVTCTSSNGATATKQITVTVNELPTVAFYGTNQNQAFCKGTAITDIALSNSYSELSATGLPTGVSLEGTTISGTPEAAGVYEYTITATSTATPSCGTASVTGAITVYALPTVSVTSSNVTICAGGSTTLQATGANSYAWEPETGLSATTGESVTAQPADTTKYYVTGTENVHNCSAKDSIVINVNALPNTELSQATYSVCAGSTVDLSATGADSYSWSVSGGSLSDDTGTPVTFTAPTTPGDYTVTLTGKNTHNCEKEATGTITVNALPEVTVSGDEYVCNGSFITLTAVGAASYKWNNDKTTDTIHVYETASYTVEGTDANGCKSSSQAHSVTKESPAVTITDDLQDKTICKGGNTTLTASTSDVVGNLSYNWNTTPACNTATTGTLSPTTTTDYTVTVTATSEHLNTCSVTADKTVTVTVLDPSQYTIGAVTGTNAICAGETTTLTANPTTAQENYTFTYQWLKGGAAIADATESTFTTPELRSNTTYSVEIKAKVGDCTSAADTSADFPVTVNARPQVTIALTGDVATVTTSESGLSYQWKKGDTKLEGQTSNVLSGCESNSTYTCVVTNNTTGCDTSVSVTTPYIPTSIALSPKSDVKFCYNNGEGTSAATYTADLDDPEHNDEFSYNWYYDGNLVTTPEATAHKNTFTKTYVVGDAGTHTVKVEVVGQTTLNDTYTQTVVVPNPHISAVTITGNTAFCHDGNTTLTASATSDNDGVITYEWSNSLGSNAAATVSAAGTYTVTATSTLNNCTKTATASATVTENNPTAFTVSAITGTNSICKNGTTTLTANPETEESGYTYTYQWYKGNQAVDGATNATYTTSALTETTTYTVKVKAQRTVGGATCTSSSEEASAPFEVTVTQPISKSISNGNQTVCAGENITPMVITHNGVLGTPENMPSGVSLSEDTISGAPSEAGTFNIRIPMTTSPLTTCGKDTLTAVITVNALPNAPEVEVVGNVATITNPQDGITYTWDNSTAGISTTYAAGAAATHTVTAKNNTTGCEKTAEFPVSDIASSISLGNLDIAYCADKLSTDAAKKEFTATPTPEGTYTYTWKVDGNVQASTSSTMSYTFSDATTGTHTISVSVAGASTSGTSNVTVYPLPTITVASGDVTQDICKGAPIANVTFTTNNGTPAIDGTANGLTLNSNVLSGTPTADCNFNIEVSSSQGCTPATQAVQITRKDTATLTVNGDKNRSVCKGSSLTITFNSNAQLSASQIPAGMSFDNNTLSGTPTATGSYTITTASLNNCGTKTITGTVTVKELPAVSISTTDSKTAICNGENITLTATAELNSYSWSNAGSSSNVQQVTPEFTTTYTVTVSDGSCTNTASTTITVNELPTVSISGNDEMCAGASGNKLTANVSPTATYNYQWRKGGADITGATLSTLDITESATYTVAATNTATGCSNTSSAKTVTVKNPTITSVSISAAPGTSICEGSSTTLTASPFGANGSVSYSWSTGSSNSSVSVNAAGTYSVSATVKIGNCTSSSVSASQQVTVKPLPTVTLSPETQTLCTGVAISPITITPANATISEDTGLPAGVFRNENTISGTPTVAGTYTASVTVNSTNGCGTKTGTANITVNPAHTLSDLSLSSQTVCKNSPMTAITFTSSNATVTSSDLPDGVTLTHNGDNYTISGTPTEDGTFNFTVTAASTYDCGEALTKTGTITVKPQPNASITADPNKNAICNGDEITLTVAESGVTYSWSPSASTQAVTVTPTTTTTYYVTVTKDGCTATSNKTITVNARPSVSISSSAGDAVCDGATTTLTANASNCNYLWDYQNITAQTITPTITATKEYKVTVTDKTTGCTNSASKTITKKSLPTLNLADISGNTTICNGSNTTLSVNHSGDNINTVAYSWTPATGLSATNTQTVTAAPTATTTYSVSVTATSADGCTKSASKSATVTVNSPAVTLSDMQNEAICNGSSITINAPVQSHNGDLSYSWTSNPAGFTSTNSSITPTPTANTTYTVEVTAKVGDCTKSASKSKTVTLNPLPTISVSGTKDQSVCVGAAISDITAANLVSGSTVACTWSPSTPAGINYNSSTKTISGTPSAAGTYTYTLKASLSQTPDCDNDGAKVSGTITVKALPDVTSISGNTAFCEGSNTTLSVSSISGASYLWNNSATTNSITVSEAGNYSVTVTGSNGCAKAVPAVTVTKNLNPSITVSDIALCSGQTATFTATNVTSGATVSWSTTETGCSLSPTTGTTTNLTYPSGAGTYTVTGTATTAAGCASSDNATATITSPNAGTLALSANNTTICNGSTVTLTASVSGNSGSVQSYKWYKGNDVISGATSNTYTTPALTESATFKCVATIKDGDCTAETEAKTQTITVLSPAVTSVSIAANPESAAVCNGSSVTLTASAEGTGTMSYTWSTGETGNSIEVTPTTATTYTVTATATSTENGVSCTATTPGTADQIVTVRNASLENVVVEAASNKLCPGGSVELYAAAETYQGELSYQWYKGSNAISDATSNSYAATETGSYSCKITANDNGCMVDATSDAVTITSTNYALTLVGPTSPVNLCGNTNATLVYNALLVDNDNDGAVVPDVTYSWSEGTPSADGSSDTLIKSATNTTGTAYTVTVTAIVANCSAQTQSISTTVKKQGTMPTARICENITSLEAKVFEGTTLKTTDYSYAWYAADDLETVLSTDPAYAPSEPGYYTCIVTQTEFGCTASATGMVTNHVFTDKPCNIAVPNDNEHLNENGQLMYVTDHENNNYAVVQIGDQCWLRENMRVTTSPKDNAPIRTITGVQTGESSARYTEQNGNYWYTWTAALDTFRTRIYPDLSSAPMLNATEPQRGICPEGWHIPTREEFTTLTTGQTNGDLSSGCDWRAYNSGAQYGYAGNYNYENRNSTGFSANGIGWFHGSQFKGDDGSNAQFVTATEYGNSAKASIYCALLTYNQTSPVVSNNATGTGSKVSFLSVRCIRGGAVAPSPDNLGVTVTGPDTLYYCTATNGVSGTYTATAVNAEDDVTYTWKVNPTTGATVTPNGNTCTINFSTGTDKQRNFVVSCVVTSNGNQAGASHSTLVVKTPAPTVDICTGTERDAKTAATITTMRNVDHIVWVNGGTTITTDATVGYHLIPNGTTIPYGTYNYTVYGPDVNCTVTGTVTIPQPIPTYCSVTTKNSNETVGTGTGDQIEFINDHEGNAYKIMEIGGRCWMRENLKTMSSPAEGHPSYYVPNKQGHYTTTLRECYVYQRGDEWYDTNFPDTNSNKQFFGLLYNWACANDIAGDPSLPPYSDYGRRHVPALLGVQNVQGMCPDGWHLPTSVEWSILADSIRAYFHSDYISVRLAGSCAWKPGNATWGAGYYNDPDRRNVLLFTVLPAGDYTGKSSELASLGAHFWCATQEGPNHGVYFYMNWDSGYFNLATNHRKDIGMSIRCVRND